MTRYRLLLGAALVLVVLTLGGLGRAAVGAPRQTRSLNGGVYTRKQADRGAKLYKRFCSECHQPDEFKDYLRRWVGLPVSYLYDSVSSTMPQNNPGALSRKRYADVLTYLFAINGVPTGEHEMGAEVALLDDITIEIPPDEGRP